MTTEIEELRQRLRDETCMDVEMSIVVRDRIAELRTLLKSSETQCDEVQYFADTAGILFRYYTLIDAESKSVAQDIDQDIDQAGDAYKKKKPTARTITANINNKNKNNNNNNSILRYFGVQDTTSIDQFDARQKQVAKREIGPAVENGEEDGDEVEVGEECLVEDREEVMIPQRGSLLDHYMECTNKNYVKEPLLVERISSCKHCKNKNMTMMNNDGYMLCNSCHTVEYVIVDHDKPSYKDPPKEISYYAYKRLNHFNEWLNQVQGKETTDIPDEVFDLILLEIKKQKVDNIALLTHSRIKAILKKIKINKYYEHVPYIINRLNGIPMPHLPLELEETFRSMFKQIQAPFLKHSPMSRKNFLSYSFVLHKMSQLMGRDEYLVNFPLLKSREKLQQQDQIWCKICHELNWEFIKSL